MDIDSFEVINVEKFSLEKNIRDNYFIYVIDRIYINISKGLFFEFEFVVWG